MPFPLVTRPPCQARNDKAQEEREQDDVKATGPGAEADRPERQRRQADPLPCRPGRLERRAEAEAVDRVD